MKKPANRTTSPTRLHQQPPWSTGVKTYNGALGVDIHEKDHPTILEMAKAAGLATGNVSTAELQDATPAALVAHVTSRKCYGPSATSEKCPGNALEKRRKRIDYRTAA
ncbi:alkaline phosphatase [Escherichia coli]|uniref:alkaline phosphatase n=1 Tax=Escherichia coli TaxID=562 RepID=UPI00388F2108